MRGLRGPCRLAGCGEDTHLSFSGVEGAHRCGSSAWGASASTRPPCAAVTGAGSRDPSGRPHGASQGDPRAHHAPIPGGHGKEVARLSGSRFDTVLSKKRGLAHKENAICVPRSCGSAGFTRSFFPGRATCVGTMGPKTRAGRTGSGVGRDTGHGPARVPSHQPCVGVQSAPHPGVWGACSLSSPRSEALSPGTEAAHAWGP